MTMTHNARTHFKHNGEMVSLDTTTHNEIMHEVHFGTDGDTEEELIASALENERRTTVQSLTL